MKYYLSRYWEFLLGYWNSLLAAASVIGVACSVLIPGADKYVDFFIFVGLNAVVWTLVEIKHELRRGVNTAGARVFDSMRDARAVILQSILGELAHSGTREVLVLGGRIRSITEIFREFADVVERGDLPARASGLSIKLVCISPDFLERWPAPGALSVAEREAVGQGFAGSVRASAIELAAISRRDSLKRRGIEIEVSYYSSIPTIYGYVFDESRVIWGGYTWDEDGCDVQGPSNPSYLIEAGQPDFESVRSWLTSQAALLQALHAESAAGTV